MLEFYQPEFQKRADGFKLEVLNAIAAIKKERPMPMFDITVDDPLEDLMDGLHKLGEIVGDNLNDTGFETPEQMSQRLDQQSAREAIVRIYGQSEFREMLKRLVDEARVLAEKYGGSPSDFMSLLQTTDAKDGIKNLGAEGEYLWDVHLNFTFT